MLALFLRSPSTRSVTPVIELIAENEKLKLKLKGGRLNIEMENHEKSARGVALHAARKERTSRPELDGATRLSKRRNT